MQFFTAGTVSELPLVALIAAGVVASIWLSNLVYDRGTPHYVSRKLGHAAGGFAYLISLLFSSAGLPILIALGFGSVLLGARLVKPHAFRGVGGSGRNERVMAEVWFAWVGAPVFAVSWLWLDRPDVAVASLLYMAWGDGVTGIVRSRLYHRAVKGLWGSLAMLIVCLGISAMLIEPFWTGAVASLVAVATEWVAGDCAILKWADDNWAIPLVSMSTLIGVMAVAGNL